MRIANVYDELTLTVKWYLLYEGFQHIVKLTDVRNEVYNVAKSPFPGTSFLACSTRTCL